jgi:hypothetical protein
VVPAHRFNSLSAAFKQIASIQVERLSGFCPLALRLRFAFATARSTRFVVELSNETLIGGRVL